MIAAVITPLRQAFDHRDGGTHHRPITENVPGYCLTLIE
jgi:hypothetical protein